MAKMIKELTGTFDFTGVLVGKELKKNEDSNKNGQFTFRLFDNQIESEVKLSMWEGNEGAYWDNGSKKMIKVPKDKVNVTMKEIVANATGSPFDIRLIVGGKETIYYVNNDVIAVLNKLADKKYTLSVTGTIKFKTYKGKLQKEYTIKTIEVNSKKPIGFNVKIPVVLSESTKDKLKFNESLQTVPMLVKAKLEEGGYGYRPINVGLSTKHFLNGIVEDLAKNRNESAVSIINDTVLPSFINMMKVNEGYISALMIGRLKVGEITKKPTIDNLNPIELVVLKLQGEEAIKDKLSKMEMITEYFDSMYFNTFEETQSGLFEPISENELNLPNNSTNNQTINSNPMLDIVNGLMLNNTEENKTNNSVVEDIDNNEIAEIDELEALINLQEDSFNPSSESENTVEDEDFPF